MWNGKKVADERTEFMNFVREYSDKEQDKFAGSTSLGKNEKKLLEKLGGALGMTLESRDELHYMVTKGIPVFALYTIFSNAKYKCNKEKYPLEELRDFCDKNKYKVKLVMLDSSANLSTEDLKSKLSDYISGQALDKLNHLIDQLNVKLHDNQGMYENLMKLDTYLVKELKKAIIQKDDYSIRYYKKEFYKT
ncbi:hypothetical protein [Wolbachia endosymbiont of Diaphorina citri]|uniref:hypothetical protein n=1 Tax=Wolbachia endosymbiont of Diaphorina citri TaxID=116598 RepID=UPI00223F7316|nr:hypothetical protein [Wolbachia endosymbiont of Diaphorina citri]